MERMGCLCFRGMICYICGHHLQQCEYPLGDVRRWGRSRVVAPRVCCLPTELCQRGQPECGEWKFLPVGWERHIKALFPITFIWGTSSPALIGRDMWWGVRMRKSLKEVPTDSPTPAIRKDVIRDQKVRGEIRNAGNSYQARGGKMRYVQ